MIFGEDGEAVEESGPDEAEEEDDEEDDLVWFCVVGGPEISPVTAVGGTEEIVLDEDGDEEPEYYFATDKRGIERRDVAGFLAVVVREAEIED